MSLASRTCILVAMVTVIAVDPALAQCSLYLNELLLGSVDTVELHNASDEDIDLTGWIIQGDLGCIHPNIGEIIPAHGYLVLESDEEIFDPIGGQTILIDDLDIPQDRFDYGNIGGGPTPGAAVSVARAPDASDSPPRFADPALYWTLDFSPTLGVGNDAPVPNLGASIRINEIDSRLAFPQSDRVELFNPTVGAVDLTNWFLTRGASEVQIFLGGVLGPGAWTSFLIDPLDDLDESQLLYLFDASQIRIDQAGWSGGPDLENGQCWARYPDGMGASNGYDFETSELTATFCTPDLPNCPPAAGCDTLLSSADGTFEDRLAWGDSAVVAPQFGAFAECFSGEFDLCAIALDLTQDGTYSGEQLDLYIWEDDGGQPSTVLYVDVGRDPGPPAVWPAVSQHLFGGCGVGTPATWWAGFWGNWENASPGFAIGADLDGGVGCPVTNIAPGTGFPTGWQDVSIAFGPVAALGIGVRGSSAPSPGRPEPSSLSGSANIGACCLSDSLCEVRAELHCLADCGDYHGDGSQCDPSPCIFHVAFVDPLGGSGGVDPLPQVSAIFSGPVDASSLEGFRLRGEQLGFIAGSAMLISDTTAVFEAALEPGSTLGAGHLLEAMISRSVRSADGEPLVRSHAWRFRTAAEAGTGEFENTSYAASATLVSTAAGDLDGDGDLDVVGVAGSCPCDSLLFIYENQSEIGGPIDLQPVPIRSVGRIPSAVALADMNDDGRLDILLADQGRNVFDHGPDIQPPDDFIHVGLGTAVPFEFEWRRIPTERDPQRVAVADFDGDGALDFAVVCAGSDRLQVFLGDGAGGILEEGGYDLPPLPRDLAATDLDLDGDIDLIAMSAGADSGRVTVFHNWSTVSRPDSLFRKMCVVALPSTAGLLVDTISPDRIPDLVVTREDADSVCVFVSGPSGIPREQICFGTSAATSGETADSLFGITAFDFDGDEDLDLAITARAAAASGWILFENLGEAGLQYRESFSMSSRPELPMSADFDQDGVVDLLVPGESVFLAGGGTVLGYRGVAVSSATDEEWADLRASNWTGVPNPFSERVRFAILPELPARLEVFDASGRRVRSIEASPGGPNHLEWDGSDQSGRGVAAGVYHVRLIQGDRPRSTTVLRLR